MTKRVKTNRHNKALFQLYFIICLSISIFFPWDNCLALELDGNLIQGGLVYGKIEPGAHLWLDDKPIRVSPEGNFVIGFGRKHKEISTLKAKTQNNKIIEKEIKIKQRKYETQHISGLPPNKVTPTNDELERIRKEIILVKNVRKIDSESQDYLTGFDWPVIGRVTGVYGSQRILNDQPRSPHYGIDIAAAEGTFVRAPANGVVTFVHNDMFFSGKTLIIDHGHGLSSTFLHLSKIEVKKGDSVQKGNIIAEVGSTGRSTGAHLDWRINWFARRLDPRLLTGPMPQPLIIRPFIPKKEDI